MKKKYRELQESKYNPRFTFKIEKYDDLNFRNTHALKALLKINQCKV